MGQNRDRERANRMAVRRLGAAGHVAKGGRNRASGNRTGENDPEKEETGRTGTERAKTVCEKNSDTNACRGGERRKQHSRRRAVKTLVWEDSSENGVKAVKTASGQ